MWQQFFENDPVWAWLCALYLFGLCAVTVLFTAVICGALISSWRREYSARRRRFYQDHFIPNTTPPADLRASASSAGTTTNPEVSMKSRLALVAILAIALTFASLMTGCGTLGNGKLDVPFADTPYQAGRTFVFVDTVTEPFQPEEVALVIDQVYAIARMNLDADNLGDELVRNQIDQTYAESTPEARQMIFNVYTAMLARLDYQLELNADLPDITVLNEFNRGIRDALAIYQPNPSP